MSFDAAKGVIDTAAVRHARNAARFALPPWMMAFAVMILSFALLSADRAGSAPYWLSLAVVGSALPMIVFILMGPFDMARMCKSAPSWMQRIVLSFGYVVFLGVSLFAASLPFASPFKLPLGSFTGLPVVRQIDSFRNLLTGYIADMSSTQLLVGIVWAGLLVWLPSQLLALRGFTLQDPDDLATTYMGVGWLFVLLHWLITKLIAAPGAMKRAAAKVKDAPGNFKGARDEAQPLSEASEVVATRYEGADEEDFSSPVPPPRTATPLRQPSVAPQAVLRPSRPVQPSSPGSNGVLVGQTLSASASTSQESTNPWGRP